MKSETKWMVDQFHRMSNSSTQKDIMLGEKKVLSSAEKHIKNMQMNQIQPSSAL